MLELIGNFEFDNKLFYMFKKQNTIWFALKEAKKLSLKLTKEELNICKQVYDKITPRKEYTTYQTTIPFNGKDILIYYDEYTHLNYFLQCENGKNVVPSKEDLITLNMIFNNEKEYWESKNGRDKSDQKSEKSPYFRKVIGSIANKTIIAFLCASMVFSSLPSITYAQSKDSQEIESNILVADDNLGNFTYEEIEEQISLALNENPYLTEEQKDWLRDPSVAEMIYNNRFYIYRNLGDLKKLKIEMAPKLDKETTGGLCYKDLIKLKIIENEEGKLSDQLMHNFYHEFTHWLSISSPTSESLGNHSMYETLVEAFSSSYFPEYVCSDEVFSSGYSGILPFAYVLVEIFPREKVVEAMFSHSMKVLENEAKTIDPKLGLYNFKKVESLLGMINYNNADSKQLEKWHNEAYEALNNLYKAKFPARKEGIKEDPSLYLMFQLTVR